MAVKKENQCPAPELPKRKIVWMIAGLLVWTAGGVVPEQSREAALQADGVIHDDLIYVQSGADDYKENTSGEMAKGGSSLDYWTTSAQYHAYRFQHFPVIKESGLPTTIIEAKLEVYATGNTAGNSLAGYARGHKVGNSGAYTGVDREISNLIVGGTAVTAARVDIANLPPWTSNAYNTIADVTPIVQEIVDQATYNENNAIKLFLVATSTLSSRKAKTYDSSPQTAARLRVKWTNARVPIASFTAAPTSGTAPLCVHLDAQQSHDDDGVINQYSWNFGDGTAKGSGIMVDHCFTAGGEFIVKLTVTDNDQLTGMASTGINVTGEQQVTLQIASSGDDYRENADHKTSATQSSHELWTQPYFWQAYRFINVPVPPDATILEARLEGYAWGTGLSKVIRGTAFGHYIDNAPGFNPANFSISARTQTPASSLICSTVDASCPAANRIGTWTVNAFNKIADVTQIVQQIVDRPPVPGAVPPLDGWRSGNAIVIMLRADSTADYRKIRTYDYNPAQAARLYIRWTTAP
jgi:PKD repeat protein